MIVSRIVSLIAGLVVAALLPTFSLAASVDPKVSAAIKGALEKRYPGTHVLDVRPAPVPSLYEVYTGDAIAYTDATGDFLFIGPLVDTRTHHNLTSEHLNARGTIDFSALPLDEAIKTVRGDGSRTLAVFSDPDCPFCQRLENELKQVDNVTIYTFLYPIASLHPQAPVKARAIWCSANRSQAWSQWMVDKKDPGTASCAANPIDKLQTLGDKLHINSTPTLFATSGKRMEGVVPAAQLEKLLASGTAPKGATN